MERTKGVPIAAPVSVEEPKLCCRIEKMTQKKRGKKKEKDKKKERKKKRKHGRGKKKENNR